MTLQAAIYVAIGELHKDGEASEKQVEGGEEHEDNVERRGVHLVIREVWF